MTALKETRVEISKLADAILKRNKTAYSGKFKTWLEGAAAAGVVKLTKENKAYWATLNKAIPSTPTPPPPPQVNMKLSPSISPAFKSLQLAIKSLASRPGEFVLLSQIAPPLSKALPGGYKAAGYSKLKNFVLAAEEAGLVRLRGGGGADEIANVA